MLHQNSTCYAKCRARATTKARHWPPVPNRQSSCACPKARYRARGTNAGDAELDPKTGALPEAPKAGPALEAPMVNPVEGAEAPAAWDAAGSPNAKLGAEAAAGTGASCQAEALVTLLAKGTVAVQHRASRS